MNKLQAENQVAERKIKNNEKDIENLKEELKTKDSLITEWVIRSVIMLRKIF